MLFSIPTVVPYCSCDDRKANKGEYDANGDFCALGEARVAGERGVTWFAARPLGGERASLQVREERIRGVI